MIDLPSVPRRLVTTEAAKSSVTAADIAGPYKSLGNALDNLGEGLEAVSVVAADKAAQTAVTRDADGQLQVEMMPPMMGKAGVAYNRIAKQGYLAQLEGEANTQITKARADYEGRPEEFKSWSQKYLGELVSKQPDETLQNSVRIAVGGRLDQTYDGLISQRARLDLARDNAAVDSKILTLSDDMEVLARKGGTGTPQFVQSAKDFEHLLDEKVKNPLLAFPKEKADRLREEVYTRAEGAAIIDRVETIYRDQGFDAARSHLREAVGQLDAKLKSASKIERQGLAWLRSEEAGFRGERDAISREWADAKAKGNADTLPRDTLLDIQERARAVGNVRVDQDIAVRLGSRDITATLRNLPDADRANIAITGKVNLPLVDRIVGAESKGDPNARPVDPETGRLKSSAAGTGQFIEGTWLGLMKKYRPDLAAGHSDGELLSLRTLNTPEGRALNREMVGRYAEDNGRSLQSAGVPVNDASLYLAHFLGPGDAAKVLKADAAQPVAGLVAGASLAANREVFSKAPTAGDLIAWAGRKVGVGEGDLTKSREGLVALGMLKREISKDIGDRITGLQNAVAKQEIPDAAEAEALLVQVHALGTPEQQKKVAELAAIASVGADFNKLPADKRAAVVSAMQEKGRQGASQFERNLSAALVKADGAINTAYNNDPYGAAYRYADVSPLAPVDWTKPDAAAATIKAKVAQQNTIRADQNMGPFSALRPAEADALKTTLTQADPQVAAAALGTLQQTLPADVYRVTMADKTVREGLDGMVRSYDPARLNVAMTTLDQLYRSDPVGFAHNFGAETFGRLQTWQARKDSLTPQQMSEYFARADDPAQKSARKSLLDDADEKLKKITPADVALSLGGSWSITPAFVSQGITGSDARPPSDPVQAETLAAEWKSLVRERYVDTGNIDTAKQQAGERIKTAWGPSDINSNALMKYPPERYYPQVGGSHGWMTADLEKSLETVAGPRLIFSAEPDVTGTPTPGVKYTYKVMSDPQTESDVKAGRPPSYVVMLTDAATGRVNVPLGADGQALRYRFDPSAAQGAARAAVAAERDDATARRQRAADDVRAMQEPMRRLIGQ